MIFRGKLRDFLSGRSVRDASNGLTQLRVFGELVGDGLLREGIVIKDASEERSPGSFERVAFKQRDPVYLATTGN